MFEPGMVEKFVAMYNQLNAGGAAPQVKPGELVSAPLMKGLVDNFGNQAGRVLNILSNLDGEPGQRLKALGTVETGALRLVSISDRIAVKRNADTVWLNMLQAKPAAILNDYQYRIIERDPLDDNADLVSADRTTQFPEKNSVYNVRYNTLTVIGNTVKASWMAQNIAQQQRGVDLMGDLADDQVVRMHRTMNRILMSNTEQVLEGPLNVPQLGGFMTRSTVNPINAGASNFTNTLLQTGVESIYTELGSAQELVLLVSEGQAPVIADLMINRFNGEASTDFNTYQNSLRGRAMATAGVEVECVYKPRPGNAIPVIVERELPANTAILFDNALPRMARFRFNGSIGPHILVQLDPNQAMYDVVAIFDMFTLDDPLQVSRVVYSNLAS